jgi:hypothetical protein
MLWSAAQGRAASSNQVKARLTSVGVAGAILAYPAFGPGRACAYTAAGDRFFASNLVLPQIAPSDAFWIDLSTQPEINGQQTNFMGTFAKTLTDRFGIQISDGVTRLGSMTGGQNLDLLAQYEAVIDPGHEFVFSFQVDHQVGTGNNDVDSFRQSATQPAMTFGKGLGDVPIEALRPFAVTGFLGYQIAEGSGTRPSQINTGFTLQYSVPYLVSKVTPLDLPPMLRGMIPVVEVMWSVPTGNTHHAGNTLTVAPGINYAEGAGWEVAIEALIPANKASGTGIGVIAQVVIQFDYLLPDSILGRPVFARH